MSELLSFASVGMGGAAGALLRYECGRIFKKHLQSDFPLSTFAINTSGAFLLGMLTGLGVKDICYLLFGTGALAASRLFPRCTTKRPRSGGAASRSSPSATSPRPMRWEFSRPSPALRPGVSSPAKSSDGCSLPAVWL